MEGGDLMSTSLLVGIDVSSRDNKVRFLDSSGTSLAKFLIPNNQPVAELLSERITKTMNSHKLDSLVLPFTVNLWYTF